LAHSKTRSPLAGQQQPGQQNIQAVLQAIRQQRSRQQTMPGAPAGQGGIGIQIGQGLLQQQPGGPGGQSPQAGPQSLFNPGGTQPGAPAAAPRRAGRLGEGGGEGRDPGAGRREEDVDSTPVYAYAIGEVRHSEISQNTSLGYFSL